jgi:hypothetical protein
MNRMGVSRLLSILSVILFILSPAPLRDPSCAFVEKIVLSRRQLSCRNLNRWIFPEAVFGN